MNNSLTMVKKNYSTLALAEALKGHAVRLSLPVFKF